SVAWSLTKGCPVVLPDSSEAAGSLIVVTADTSIFSYSARRSLPGRAEAEIRSGDFAAGLVKSNGFESGMLHRSEAEIQQLNPHGIVYRQEGPEGQLIEAFEYLECARGASAVDGGRRDRGIFGMAAPGVEIGAQVDGHFVDEAVAFHDSAPAHHGESHWEDADPFGRRALVIVRVDQADSAVVRDHTSGVV